VSDTFDDDPVAGVFRLWHQLVTRREHADADELRAIDAEARCATDAARNERHQSRASRLSELGAQFDAMKVLKP
jgi:hypothetical protein